MVKNIIYLPDGTEIASGTGFAIKSSSMVRCVNSGEELTIGSTCANKAEFTLFDVGGNLSVNAGEEIIHYRDDGTTRKKMGVYILEKPSRPSANMLKLVGYDRVTKLDRDMTDWVTGLTEWPYDLLTFAKMVCTECGLSFVTTEAPNSDFLVYSFRKNGVTGRKIMQWLAEICGRFCRANADGDIELAWYEDSGVAVHPSGNRYFFKSGLSYETFTTAPIDAVQIRLADSESGAVWPSIEDGLNSYVITGNAILNARVTEDLQQYLDVIQGELADAVYTPCEVAIPACLDVDVGHKMTVVDKNGKSITAYVMTKRTSGQRDVIQCTGSASRMSTTAVNNSTDRQEAISMTSAVVLYYHSTSPTALAGGSWSDTAPTWTAGKYIWTKTVTTYSDGKVYESAAACITGTTGATGATGATGNGISSITAQFYLSTSKTTQSGGSWVTTMPTWSEGYYLWTRSKIVYTNGTTAYTSPICDSSWEAVNNLDAKLDQTEVFNRLTNNGELQGVYMEDGNLYINASYIKAGELLADLIKAGVISSVSGTITFDLDNNVIRLGASSGAGYRYLFNPVGITGRKYASDTAFNELLNITIDGGKAVITDNTWDDGDPKGIELYGKGHTYIGTGDSETNIAGSAIGLAGPVAVYGSLSVNGKNVLTLINDLSADDVGAAPATESADYPGCYYRTEGEWINPPLVPGNFYATTERYNGATVKVGVYEMTLTTATSEKATITSVFPSGTIIGISGSLSMASIGDYLPVPFYRSDSEYCSIEVIQGVLYAYHSASFTGFTLRVLVKFV